MVEFVALCAAYSYTKQQANIQLTCTVSGGEDKGDSELENGATWQVATLQDFSSVPLV